MEKKCISYSDLIMTFLVINVIPSWLTKYFEHNKLIKDFFWSWAAAGRHKISLWIFLCSALVGPVEHIGTIGISPNQGVYSKVPIKRVPRPNKCEGRKKSWCPN